MGDCCNCHNEVSRDGSGQLSRYLAALDPSYALVDDRNIKDLLVFAKRYANQVRFYDIPESNIPGEDKAKISWREFFRRDIAVIAASIALTDTYQIKKDYEELRAKIDEHPSYKIFDDLFDPILGMAVKIDGWYSLAIPENPLYADLQLAIDSNLKWQMQKIAAYEEGFKYVDSKHLLNLDYSAITNKDLWGLNDTINADISIYQGTDTEDKIRNAALYVDDIFNSFYGFINQLIKNSEGYMQFALEQYPAHQPHMALFISFLQLFRLAQDEMNGITQRMLDFYYNDVLHLTAQPSMPDKVHIVFELAKDVAEYPLTKGTLLKAPKDTAGKDQVYAVENDLVVNGAKVKEIKNIFIEKKSVEVPDTADPAKSITKQVIQNIYARPIANSKDGFGEKFMAPDFKWQTFGKGSAVAASNNLCDQAALPDEADRKDQARIGFAIASPQLVLQGGKRLIKIGVNTSLLNDDTKKIFAEQLKELAQSLSKIEIWLTGENGWIKIFAGNDNDITGQLSFVHNASTDGIFSDEVNKKSFYVVDAIDAADVALCVYLPIAEQAVSSFNPKLHTGYNFKTNYPVMLLLNDASADLNIDIDIYRQFVIPNLTIRTKVGSVNSPVINATGSANPVLFHFDGLKKLVLQNKDSLIVPGKPFDPFTAYPFLGRSFYIGSDEIFNKPFNENNNDKLAVNIFKTLDEQTDDNSNGTALTVYEEPDFNWAYNVSILKNRQWSIIKDANKVPEVLLQEDLTANILNPSVLSLNRTPVGLVTEWKSETEKGFIKLDLTIDSSEINKKFKDNFLAFNEAAEKTSFLQLSQNLAPGLEIKEISVSYDSTLTLEMGVDQFFHIYPFGVAETYLKSSTLTATGALTNFSMLDEAKEWLLVDAGNALFPQFDYLSPYAEYSDNAISLNAYQGISSKRDILTERLHNRNSTATDLIQNARDSAIRSTNQYTGDMQEGTLYIGLEKLQPLQSISMLFQFAEGSAYNEDDDPPQINWAYLSYNEWKPLKAENIVFDGTYGFQTTGIIKIDIPADASTHNTIITDGLLWLCASVTENADRIPQLIDIVTQAAEAIFVDQNNDASHFNAALPAGSISKLSVPVAQMSKVQQPFSAFDGKHKEIGKEFYTRVSERLRHKGRAITAWDYEHLVLDRFPSVYKVKCITHTDPNCLCTDKLVNTTTTVLPARITFNGNNATLTAIANQIGELLHSNPLVDITLVGYDFNGLNRVKEVYNILTGQSSIIIITQPVDPLRINYKIERTTAPTNTTAPEVLDVLQTEACCGPQVAPGHVLIIPVADLKNRNAANPLQPKTSRRTLIAIQDYLKIRTSPFVHVHAKNPIYEQIIVSFKVNFYSGADKGFYMKKLNEEIVRFLTPWAFDEHAEVTFNQKIYASSIVNFIEERSYVDFITDFIMGVCCNDCCPPSDKIGNGTITGIISDDVNNPQPLQNIVVKIKEINKAVTTDVNGSYTIENIPAGNYTIVAYFSLFNIQKQSFTADKQGNITQDGNRAAAFNFFRGAGNRQDDVNEFFSTVCGCEGVEWLLKDDPNFKGDVTAKPCTSRSLLVSVPQHIIIPYEETPLPSPCEQRKNQSAFSVSTADTVSLKNKIITQKVIADTSVKIEAKKPADKILTEKKTESVPAKKAKASPAKQPKKKPQ